MKKIFLCLFFLLVPICTFARNFQVTTDEGVKMWFYSPSGNSAYVGYYDENSNYYVPALLTESSIVVIPSTVKYMGSTYRVIGCLRQSFKDCASISEVRLPESINRIDREAFSGCTNLKTINLSSITQILDNAFTNCTSLESIGLLNNLSFLGKNVFAGCTSLTSIIIPEGITYIPQNAFDGCSNLKSVLLPTTTGTIQAYAFHNCANLSSITFPESVQFINEYAFSGCANLSSIVIPGGITSIDSNTFSGCTNLTSIILPKGLTSIGANAFSGCTNLTSVILPEGLTSIGANAFENCVNLSSLVIPNSVSSIGDFVFSGAGLISIEISSNITELGTHLFDNCNNLSSVILNQAEVNTLFQGITNIQTVTFKELVKSIQDYAFKGCTGLTSITMADGVETIGKGAFMGCINLTSAKLSERITALGDHVFEGCTSLKSITFPNNLTDIGKFAFCDCTDLISVNFNNLVNIGENAFYRCTNLYSINIPNTITSISNQAFSQCANLKQITLSENLKVIGEGAFSQCEKIGTLRIPSSVTKIERSAFNYSHIDRLVLEDGTSPLSCGISGSSYIINNGERIWTYYGLFSSNSKAEVDTLYLGRLFSVNTTNSSNVYVQPFQKCTSLKCIEIGESLSRIASDTFSGCSTVPTIISHQKTPISIPQNVFPLGSNSIIYIPYGTLEAYKTTQYWSNLMKYITGSVVVGETFSLEVPQKESKIITTFTITDINPLKVEIGAEQTTAFADANIEHYEFPTSVYGEEDKSFQVVGIGKNACSSSNLIDLTLPDGYTYIDDNAFDNCQKLKRISFPKSIKKIGNSFINCNNIDTVCVFWRDIRNIIVSSDNFKELPQETILLVPAGTKDLYSTHEVWRKFPNIIESSPIFVGDITAHNGSTAFLSINLNNLEPIAGLQFKLTLPKGANISLQEDELVTLNTDRTHGWTIMGRKDPDEDNSYLFVIFSLSKQLIEANKGAILNVMVNLADDMQLGDYDVTIENALLVTPTFDTLSPATSESVLTISDIVAGDVNGDGHIDLTDAIMIVYSSLGQMQSGFVTAAADVNGDGRIDLTDAIIVVYKSLGVTPQYVPARLLDPQ